MRTPVILFSLLIAAPLAVQAAGGTLTVPKKITYQKGASIPDAVRKECGLEEKAAEAVRNDMTGRFDKVVSADSVTAKTAGKALEMHITNVLAPGGGAWSGPKTVTIKGTLRENGKALGNFTATRYTTRGHKTCDMLENDVKAIAGDIGNWMLSPGKDALLGDAKK